MSGYAWAIITVLFALNLVQYWYFMETTWKLNRQHQHDLEDLRHEYRVQDLMMRKLTLPQMMGEETP